MRSRRHRLFFLWLLAISLLGCQQPDAVVLSMVEEPTAVFSAVTPTITNVPEQPAPIATSILTPTPPHLEIATNELPVQATRAVEFAVQESYPVSNSFWKLPEGLLNHPIDIAINDSDIFILDSGRVIYLSRQRPDKMMILLDHTAVVEDVPVLEPVDLSLTAVALYVLDRAGDVYRYELAEKRWRLDWNGRYLEESSGHYYVALFAQEQNRTLLESSYHFIQRYGDDPRIWHVPEQIGVGVVRDNDGTYVLQQSLTTEEGTVARYQHAQLDSTFQPEIALQQVRQLLLTEQFVYVLDEAGQRLVQLEKSGKVVQFIQPPPQTQAVVILADETPVFMSQAGIYWGESWRETAVHSNITILRIEPPLLSLPHQQWHLPIIGTNLTERPLQMAGAPRHYRLGIHEGTDFYWRTGTPVYAVADGTVVRATVNYERPSWQEYGRWREAGFALGKTPPEALDFYRGMQVWVEHDNGLVTRYAHLSQIDNAIAPGVRVIAGQKLGEVGNSGSPVSVDSQNKDAHLHFEVWQSERYLGQYLRPVETWELFKSLWQE